MTIDAATFRLRYPALAGKDDATINYWLTDAARIVDTGWGGEQEPATFALAAHGMARGDAAAGAAGSIPAGVTRFRSGGMDVGFSDSAASLSLSGSYGSTSYGREFAIMLQRVKGGARLVPGCGYPYAGLPA